MQLFCIRVGGYLTHNAPIHSLRFHAWPRRRPRPAIDQPTAESGMHLRAFAGPEEVNVIDLSCLITTHHALSALRSAVPRGIPPVLRQALLGRLQLPSQLPRRVLQGTFTRRVWGEVLGVSRSITREPSHQSHRYSDRRSRWIF